MQTALLKLLRVPLAQIKQVKNHRKKVLNPTGKTVTTALRKLWQMKPWHVSKNDSSTTCLTTVTTSVTLMSTTNFMAKLLTLNPSLKAQGFKRHQPLEKIKAIRYKLAPNETKFKSLTYIYNFELIETLKLKQIQISNIHS
jgi:hypothetical protein